MSDAVSLRNADREVERALIGGLIGASVLPGRQDANLALHAAVRGRHFSVPGLGELFEIVLWADRPAVVLTEKGREIRGSVLDDVRAWAAVDHERKDLLVECVRSQCAHDHWAVRELSLRVLEAAHRRDRQSNDAVGAFCREHLSEEQRPSRLNALHLDDELVDHLATQHANAIAQELLAPGEYIKRRMSITWRGQARGRTFEVNLDVGAWREIGTQRRGGDIIALLIEIERIDRGTARRTIAAWLDRRAHG